MDFDRLQYFIRVAETEHVSHAADDLNISQSALSAHIRKLETELGCALFDRNGRQVVLNETGRLFLPYARRILDEYAEAKITLTEHLRKADNEVIIYFPASRFFRDLLAQIRQQHPDVVLNNILSCNTQRELMYELLNGGVDLSISEMRVQSEYLYSEQLSYDEQVILVNKSHPFSSREHAELSEFSEDHFSVYLNRGRRDTTSVEYYCGLAGFNPQITHKSNSLPHVIEHVEFDNAVILLPYVVAMSVMQDTPLHCIHIVNPQCRADLWLSYKRVNKQRPSVVRVRESIQDWFSSRNARLSPSPDLTGQE